MTATARTFTATFAGRTYDRTSSASYTHAARTVSGAVSFHTTEAAARRRAGQAGRVVAVAVTGQDAGAGACAVCGGTGSVGSRSAVTGAVTWTACWGRAHA